VVHGTEKCDMPEMHGISAEVFCHSSHHHPERTHCTDVNCGTRYAEVIGAKRLTGFLLSGLTYTRNST